MLRNLLFTFASILFFVQLNAQSSVYQTVVNAKNETTTFKKTNLLKAKANVAQMARLQSNLKDGMVLEMDNSALTNLNKEKPKAIEFRIERGENQKPLILELVKYDVFTNDFKIKTDKIDNYTLKNQGTHYRGIVKGEKESVVALSLFDNQMLSVITTPQEGDIILGKTEQSENEYLLYKEKDVIETPRFDCGTKDIPLTPEQIDNMKNIGNTANRVNNCVNTYFELDYTLFQEKGTVDASVQFIAGVYNVVATIYQNEEITTKISEVFVWTEEDPYDKSTSGEALDAFRNYRTSYNGDIAHLVSRGNPRSGGIAWVNGLCSSYGYAYSYVYNYYYDLPTYSWTVGVIAHEMGHTLGSPHTHACTWNGNNTAIDGCGPAAGASEGCDGPLPSEGGTVMSYCHLLSGVGINLMNGFSQQPGDLIRSNVANASCLSSCEANDPPVECHTLSTNYTHVDCFGGNDGTATVSIDGGTAPFQTQWSNGNNQLKISNLSAGNYTVTVTDANNCVATGEAMVIQPSAPLNINLTGTNASSQDATDGRIVASVSGGTTPYTFQWSDNITTTNILTGQAGTYILTVTDANGCTSDGQYVLGFDAVPCPTIFFSKLAVSCYGGENGYAVVNVQGGTAPFQYKWSNGSINKMNSNLTAGDYSVEVSDANNCVVSGSVTIAQPQSAMSVSNNTTNASNQLATDGTIQLTVSGGTAPYQYSWSTGSMEDNILGAPGNYSVSINDANGCSEVRAFTIGYNDTPCPTLSVSKTDITCNGNSDGTASLVVNGGLSPYQINWSNGSNELINSNLTAGEYKVTVVDATGCEVFSEINIEEPTAIEIQGFATNASAPTEQDGTIETIVTGGNAPYTYQWSNGASEDYITAGEGNYTVKVTDANGCQVQEAFTILSNEVIVSDCEQVNIQFPYFESFENGIGIFNQNSEDGFDWTPRSGKTPSRNTGPTTAFDGENYIYLEASRNKYKTAVLNTGCIDLAGIEKPIISFAYHMYGKHTGSLAFYVSEDMGESFTQVFLKEGNQGNKWYETEIDLGAYAGKNIQLQIEGITGGRYKSDTAIDNFYIGEKPGECIVPIIKLERNHVTCNGLEDGSATIEVKNYYSGYRIDWSNGETGATVTDLPKGVYYATVTINDECFLEKKVRIRQPQKLSYDDIVVNPMDGQSNGTIEVYAMGGVPPYEMNWSNGMTGNKLTNLAVGDYELIITDANGCSLTASYILEENDGADCNDMLRLPFSEGFEMALNDFSQNMDDEMDWLLGTNNTPSPRTGPTGAYEGALFAYIEASGNSGNTGILTTPCISLEGAISPNLNFAYNMYGAHMGTLSVEVSADMGLSWTEVWSMSGDQGSSWKKAFVGLSQYANRVIQLRFKGFVPDNYRSDMAIDGILLDDAGSTLPVAKHADGLLALKDMSVYPNAIFDWTTIEFETTESTEITIKILDLNGKPIKEERLQSIHGKNQLELDLGTLEGGNYFITITNGDRVIAEKVVKVNW